MARQHSCLNELRNRNRNRFFSEASPERVGTTEHSAPSDPDRFSDASFDRERLAFRASSPNSGYDYDRERLALRDSDSINSSFAALLPSNGFEKALRESPLVVPHLKNSIAPTERRRPNIRRLIGSNVRHNDAVRSLEDDRVECSSDAPMQEKKKNILAPEDCTPIVVGATSLLKAIRQMKAPAATEGQDDDALPEKSLTSKPSGAMPRPARRSIAASPLLRRLKLLERCRDTLPCAYADDSQSPLPPVCTTFGDALHFSSDSTTCSKMQACSEADSTDGESQCSETPAYPKPTSLIPTAPTAPKNSAKRPARFSPVEGADDAQELSATPLVM